MKLYRILFILGSIGLFIFGAWGKIGIPERYFYSGRNTSTARSDFIHQSLSSIRMQMNNELCSNVVEGLKFCTPKAVLSFEVGDKIVISTSLINVSNKEVRVTTAGGVLKLLDVSITDSAGRELEIRKEILETLPFGSSRADLSKVLQPKESIDHEYNLSHFFNFEEEGTYRLEIGRLLIPEPSNRPGRKLKQGFPKLSLDPIEIEIRGSPTDAEANKK